MTRHRTAARETILTKALSIPHNGPARLIISQTECANLNNSLYATFWNSFKIAHTSLRMCHFEEFKESVFQIGTFHLQTDRSGRPVLLDKWKAT